MKYYLSYLSYNKIIRRHEDKVVRSQDTKAVQRAWKELTQCDPEYSLSALRPLCFTNKHPAVSGLHILPLLLCFWALGFALLLCWHGLPLHVSDPSPKLFRLCSPVPFPEKAIPSAEPVVLCKVST